MSNPLRFAFLALAAMLVLGIVPRRSSAQAANFYDRLDSLFTIMDTNQRLMGAITIRKADRILYERIIGYRDSTQSGWVLSDSLTEFRVGSVSKPFTAVLIYQLVDEGRLSLETKLSLFFPQIAGSDSITIRDLLGHTSGLPNYAQGMDPIVPLDRAALLRRISAKPLQFRPGTQRRYSNSNYLLLGYIVEAVAVTTYEAQLRRRIVDRIGLRRTHFGGSDAGENESRAFFFNDGRWDRQPDHAIENAGAAGGIISTSNDLTRFLSALFQGRLISRASLSEMTNGFDDGSRKSGKGLGPFAIPGIAKSGFSHDGSIGAHSALMGYVPEDSLSLALTINGHNYPINRIFFLVWSILYGTDASLPSFTRVTLADTTATSLVGVYSAEAFGLTITVRRATGATLEAQTEGQDSFPLTYVGNYRFLFVPAGILVDFEAPIGGVSPRFTLYQQQAAIPLSRTKRAP